MGVARVAIMAVGSTAQIIDGTVTKAKLAADVPISEWAMIKAGNTSGAGAISITSIPTGYKRLWILLRINKRTTGQTYMTINNDGGANYQFQRFGGNSASTICSNATAQTSITVGNIMASGESAYYSILIDNSTNPKVITSNGGGISSSTNNCGSYASATDISRLDFSSDAGDFNSSSYLIMGSATTA